MNVKDRMTQ